MIVQSLVTAFTIAFLATAMFGHVLLLRAVFVPANNPEVRKSRGTSVRSDANRRSWDRGVGLATPRAPPGR